MSLPHSGRPRLEPLAVTLLLERLAGASARYNTFAAALQAALPIICEHAQWHAGHAYVVADSGAPRLLSAGDWHVVPGNGIALSADRACKPLAKGEGLPGLVWESQEPLCVTDVRSMDARFLGRPKARIKSWFGIPVVSGSDLRGVLEFAASEPRQMHVDVVLSAAPIAAILAGAFDREQVSSFKRQLMASGPAQQQMQLLANALEQADELVAMFDRDAEGHWCFRYVNEAFLRATGYERDEVIGEAVELLCGPDKNPEESPKLRESVNAGESYRAQMAFTRKDGSELWIDVNARPVRGPGAVRHTVVFGRDVTEARMHAQRLSYEAAHDALTGLYNRRYFEQALENALHGTPDQPRRHALLFMDLDGFKSVNDTFGHQSGDKVLASFAQLLHKHMREGDVFARIGGDEFAALLHDCGPAAALRVADHLLNVVRTFTEECNGQPCTVGMTIGIACGEAGALSPAQAMHDADEACYAAKRRGGNQAAMANSAQRAEPHPDRH